jgi:methionine biosynthesis protein MetW
MSKPAVQRTAYMQVIADWVEPRARVLDLGCGRGALLDLLAQSKEVFGVGVDLDFDRISTCVKLGVTAYQGDMMEFMGAFAANHFDRVICSRTLEEVASPATVIAEALRVGRALTVGFVNYGYWKNRCDVMLRGRKPRNEVFKSDWADSRPSNPVTVADFEHFCATKGYRIVRRSFLRGDWKTPCRFSPNLLAGYALYDLTK